MKGITASTNLALLGRYLSCIDICTLCALIIGTEVFSGVVGCD